MTAISGDGDRARSMAAGLLRLPRISASQVGVCAGQPVLARGTENVHIERVLECQSAVRYMGGNNDYLAGIRGEFALAVRTEPKVQRTLENVGELLVMVRVHRDVVTFFQVH